MEDHSGSAFEILPSDYEEHLKRVPDGNGGRVNYKALFGVNDPDTKVVDNHGDGRDDLYGVRNFRIVLHGIYYRGGANNLYNRNGTRSNSNPLPTEGLENLCRQGFSDAIYFYATNYQSAPTSVDCEAFGVHNHLTYHQISVLEGENYAKVLKMVVDRVHAPERGPIYGHCWNGWHASGFAAALSLIQFCGYSNEAAVDYWKRNTDGASRGYDSITSRIRSFRPLPGMEISDSERVRLCPGRQ
jgi:hypothetical protein